MYQYGKWQSKRAFNNYYEPVKLIFMQSEDFHD